MFLSMARLSGPRLNVSRWTRQERLENPDDTQYRQFNVLERYGSPSSAAGQDVAQGGYPDNAVIPIVGPERRLFAGDHPSQGDHPAQRGIAFDPVDNPYRNMFGRPLNLQTRLGVHPMNGTGTSMPTGIALRAGQTAPSSLAAVFARPMQSGSTGALELDADSLRGARASGARRNYRYASAEQRDPARAAMRSDGSAEQSYRAEQTQPYRTEGVFETLRNGTRDALHDAGERALGAVRGIKRRARAVFLERAVGDPLRTYELLWARDHPDAARLLREFRTGRGRQRTVFGPNHAFTQGFVRSETTQDLIQRALREWRNRDPGYRGESNRYEGYGVFQPAWFDGPPAGVSPRSARIVGTPEAHVIGSFRIDARITGRNRILWRATNVMSLGSYFAQRIHKLPVIENNRRPDPYGNTEQQIHWVTDRSGRLIR